MLLASAAEQPLAMEVAAQLARTTSAGSQRLLLAASQHGVTGFVCRSVLGLSGISPELRTTLEGAQNRVLRDHLRALSELTTIAATLDPSGVPWLVLKGPALAELAYPLPHLREYVDLDLLIPAPGLQATLSRLRGAGFRLVDRPWVQLEQERAGEVRLESPGGVLVDLHWELCNDWRVRDAFQLPSTADLLDRASLVRLGTTEVHTLDPVDTLLHVALHACTSGGWRLLWLKDVAQCLERALGHERELHDRARSWQVELVVAVMVERARRTLGAPAAGPPARLVGDSPWLRLLAAVDALTPVERATGAGSLVRIVTNSTRRNTFTSAAELLRRSVLFALQGETPRSPLRGSDADGER